MRELTFVGLSGDGTALLVKDDRGTTYAVPLDERLSTAVRRDRTRPGQLEITLEPLRPKDIQARIRAGATTAEVAEAAGWEVAKVERFAGPVLAERAWIAEQAQAVEIRRPEGDIRLVDLVAERLGARGGDAEHARWDSWRRDDGRWTVLLAYPAGSGDRVATWTYDTAGRFVVPDDDEARWIVEEPEPEPEPEPRPRLVAVPDTGAGRPDPRHDTIPVVRQTDVFEAVAAAEADATEPAGASDALAVAEIVGVLEAVEATEVAPPRRRGGPLPGDEDAYTFEPEDRIPVVLDEEAPASGSAEPATSPAGGGAPGPTVPGSGTADAAAAAATEAGDAGIDDLLGGTAEQESPARPPRRGTKGRRASVPSWDEILFGAAKKDDDES